MDLITLALSKNYTDKRIEKAVTGEVELDTTLTKQGFAADAKAVGDAIAAGTDGIHVGPDKPTNPNVSVWFDTDETDATDYIPTPATAKVGQTIVVEEVDQNGKPVKWECADVGGGSYVLLNDIVMTEAVSSVEINQSDDGTPYNLKAIYLEVGCTQLEKVYGSIGYSDNNVSMTVGNSIHSNRLAHFKASERYGMNQAEYWWSARDSVRHEYRTDIPLLANSTPFQNITGFKLTTDGQLIKFTVKVWGVLA